MTYDQPTHLAQMAAREVNEFLLQAMGASGDDRAYFQRQALREFERLSDQMRVLAAIHTQVAAYAPAPQGQSKIPVSTKESEREPG